MPTNQDHPCLPMMVITPCRPTPCGSPGCIVVRCGNCGTDAHFEELSHAEYVAYVEEHCAVDGDGGHA